MILINANARTIPLENESVDMCVTSPPYWALRQYSGDQCYIWGGDDDCVHDWGDEHVGDTRPYGAGIGKWQHDHVEAGRPHIKISQGTYCNKCSAWYGALGLEPTPEQFVANMVAVFREVWRVLKPWGTLWLNLGSSYASANMNPSQSPGASHVPACGIDDKEHLNSMVIDYAYRHLCDEHLTDFQNHYRHTSNIGQQQAQSSAPLLKIVHDTAHLDCGSMLPVALPLCVQASTIYESFLRLRGECFRCSNRASFLSAPCSCVPGAQSCVHKSDVLAKTSYGNRDNALRDAQQMRRNQYKGTVCEYCIFSLDSPPKVQPHYTIKAKDLVGIPWRVAFALQTDGWYLRSDCPWFKRNPMPESATDRPGSSHEYLFLLTKNRKYYFDMEAVRVKYTKPLDRWGGEQLTANGSSKWNEGTGQEIYRDRDMRPNKKGRNLRTIDPMLISIQAILDGDNEFIYGEYPQALVCNTESYSGSHFATFPRRLAELCIKSGTSEKGVCVECGKPWERVVEKSTRFEGGSGKAGRTPDDIGGKWGEDRHGQNILLGPVVDVTTTGWQPSCTCNADTRPAIVLDPFAGSDTTGLVARKLGRSFVGLDLSFPYLHKQARKRLSLDALDEWGEGIKAEGNHGDLPLFQDAQPPTPARTA